MSVFVIGLTGCRLMPTTERKARILLKTGKAEVYQHRPFTIRLLYKTGSTIQDVILGVDTGGQHIGTAVLRERTEDTAVVLHKTEVVLRSSMEKRKLITKRKEYRRGRRYRNVRYRHPKWKTKTRRTWSREPDKKGRHWYKKKKEYTSSRRPGWLPDSLESKVLQHISWIRRYQEILPEGTKTKIELTRFDMARIKDPDIHGEMYQHGPQYDYENVKAYVFARDNYQCQVCGEKNKKLHVHHILYRSEGATDNPQYMTTVCTDCHTSQAHRPGGILYQWKEKKKRFTRGMRDMTFMNILSARLKEAFCGAWFTYGNFTNYDRRKIGLPKSHINDAIAVACTGTAIKKTYDGCPLLEYKQVRNKKRSLHEAVPRKGRKSPNRTASRNSKNTKSITIRIRNGKKKSEHTYRIWDKIQIGGKTAWIRGFTGASAYLVDKNEEYLCYSTKYRQFPLIKLRPVKRNNGWICYQQE